MAIRFAIRRQTSVLSPTRSGLVIAIDSAAGSSGVRGGASVKRTATVNATYQIRAKHEYPVKVRSDKRAGDPGVRACR